MATVKKIQGLNLIKIVATVIIICHHYQQNFGCFFPGKINFSNGNFYFGYVVELFFMISGILTYYSFAQRGEGKLPQFGTYMKKKFMRFFPMCFIVTTVYFLMQYMFYFTSGACVGRPTPYLFEYVITALFLDTGWGFSDVITTMHITWYVSVLMIMYALFWAGCYISEKKKIKMEAVVALQAVIGAMIYTKCDNAAFSSLPFWNPLVGRGMIAFNIGILVYLLTEKYRKGMRIYSYAGLVITAAFMIYDFKVSGDVQSPLIGSDFWTCVLVIYPAVLVIATTSKVIGAISQIKVFDYIESLTFLVYIWHINFILIAMKIIEVANIDVVHGYKTMFAFVVLTFVACIPIKRLVEEPVMSRVLNKNIKFYAVPREAKQAV